MSGRRPDPNEEVVLRRPPKNLFMWPKYWKVTARYEVQVSPRKRVRCVRVSSLHGIVQHYSESEFNRLFKPK